MYLQRVAVRFGPTRCRQQTKQGIPSGMPPASASKVFGSTEPLLGPRLWRVTLVLTGGRLGVHYMLLNDDIRGPNGNVGPLCRVTNPTFVTTTAERLANVTRQLPEAASPVAGSRVVWGSSSRGSSGYKRRERQPDCASQLDVLQPAPTVVTKRSLRGAATLHPGEDRVSANDVPRQTQLARLSK